MSTSSSTPPNSSPTRRVALADLLLTVGMLAIFVIAFLTALDWSFNTGVFPLLITGLGIALAVLHLVVLLVRRPVPDLHPHGEDEEVEAMDVEYAFEHAGRAMWARTLAWVFSFFLLLYVAGIFIAAPVFTIAYLRLSAKASWLLSVVYAVVIGLALYASFVVFLGLPTPPGLFQ
ncbi:tripartite tricarboxylate transporter TctB family protein [Blastococcus capsensis]|uniref:tripartite tricarboxylate transporter TctB family protein n=1 Tax=Blastococcus capsensis TaxID=1564163 RepID=UPI00254148F7|nr:tripartite tricarboxylate transporter TctB family protein [Blastococcus capsensis]MDK3255443.1 tripartite tricarboxylate transporter TctB family protein [Blastococcus capsensis]